MASCRWSFIFPQGTRSVHPMDSYSQACVYGDENDNKIMGVNLSAIYPRLGHAMLSLMLLNFSYPINVKFVQTWYSTATLDDEVCCSAVHSFLIFYIQRRMGPIIIYC